MVRVKIQTLVKVTHATPTHQPEQSSCSEHLKMTREDLHWSSWTVHCVSPGRERVPWASVSGTDGCDRALLFDENRVQIKSLCSRTVCRNKIWHSWDSYECIRWIAASTGTKTLNNKLFGLKAAQPTAQFTQSITPCTILDAGLFP